MKEVDKETRKRNQWITRALPCPDGITRIVTMADSLWHNYGWLCRRNYFRPDEDLAGILQQIAETECAEMSDEERFSAMLQGTVWEWMAIIFPFWRIGHAYNDNKRPDDLPVPVEVAAPVPRRPLRLYLGHGGRIGELPPVA